MLPLRFHIIRPYLASYIHCNFQRPPAHEVLRWLFQPRKEKRGLKYVLKREIKGDFMVLYFIDHPGVPFYYPREFAWIVLCETIDECFNPNNWHEYLANGMTPGKDDVVLDCGTAEGLFTFMVAPNVKKVFAIEPVPAWHACLAKTFANFPNVEILKVAVGHKRSEMRMANNGLSSAINSSGELSVQVETIDNLFFAKNQKVTFIKMDIEGYEFQALLGAEETIRANHPRLSITVYHNTDHLNEIEHYLKQIHSDYNFRLRGMAPNGHPLLLQAF
jgi:FkbM family methyltransferase